jgi:membrane-associated protease RseP (regulator of RpoE activity)
MNRRECQSIAFWTAAVGVLSFVVSTSTQAQQTPDTQSSPKAAARTPPPNPQPPQTGASVAEPGYLGVVADDRQEKGAGVRVVELEAGGPAEQGGLKADDLITRINDTPVHDQSDMGPVLEKLTPGSKVKFVVDRSGQQQTVEVTLGKRPPAAQRRFEKFGAIPEPLPDPNAGGGLGPDTSGAEPGRIPADVAPNGEPNSARLLGVPKGDSVPSGVPNLPMPDTQPLRLGTNNLPGAAPSHRPLLGVRTRPVTEEARQRLRLPSTNGALVVSRTLGSPAAQAGIPLDAVIQAVDGKPIGSPIDLTQLVAQAGAGREIEITYFYGGSEQRVKVKLAEFATGPSGLPGGLLGGGSVSAGEIPAPPAPQPGRLPAPNDKTRIESLERRVQQLEHRVDDLEQALNKSR